MKITPHVLEAIDNLFATKLRTLLALLGVLVGTASVVAMVSGGQLATNQALQQIKALGTNILSVSTSYTGKIASDKKSPLAKISLNTALGVKEISNQIISVAPYITTYANVNYEGKNLSGSVIGATDDLSSIMKFKLQDGRFVSLLDRYSLYCVLGQQIYKQVQSINPKPIGTQIRLGKHLFTIMGALEHAKTTPFFYANANRSIFVPLKASILLSKYAEIHNMIVKVKEGGNQTVIENQIRNYITQKTIQQQIRFNDTRQILKSMENQKRILTIFLGLIGSISLIVGGIGVMNIMLVAVTERRREIGIRMAVGAKRRDIQVMFLTEAVILSLIGGILGVLLGVLITFVIAEMRHWHYFFILEPPLIGFTVSVFVGIFFGFYPAYKASKLDPIETLRSDM